jgi:hypothetical protein
MCIQLKLVLVGPCTSPNAAGLSNFYSDWPEGTSTDQCNHPLGAHYDSVVDELQLR